MSVRARGPVLVRVIERESPLCLQVPDTPPDVDARVIAVESHLRALHD